MKFNLPDGDNLTKICCAFANSLGGFVVVGVKDRSGHFLVEGIESDSEIAKKFGDKLHAEPSIDFASPIALPIPKNSNVLYVFHVAQSPRRPHITRKPDQRIFWKRTPAGCEQMTFSEIREQFLRYEERRDKLKLLFIELLVNREDLNGASRIEGSDTYSLVTLDSSVLDRLLVDTYSVIQGEHQLIRILLTMRGQIRLANTKAKIFFGQMALPLSNTKEIVASHNQYMKERATFILPLITEAIGILENRLGLTDPLPNEPVTG
jgi:hypothetical protein